MYSLAADAAEEEVQNERGHYLFQLAELTAAGSYSAVAEYTESRPELAEGLSKKDATKRSPSVQFHVQAGQPVLLRWDAAARRCMESMWCERLHACSGTAALRHDMPVLAPTRPARLEAASKPDKLAVTNGSNAKQRLLLRNAAVQLQDEYGNAAAGSGVQVGCEGRRGGGFKARPCRLHLCAYD